MVIDTSAIIAVIFDEPERQRFSELIVADPRRILSAANLVEASLIAESRRGALAQQALDLLLARMHVEIVAIDAEQASIARRAIQRFGKGRHPANLNFGDCFAYALCQVTNEPLLFKGDDFARTDVRPVAS